MIQKPMHTARLFKNGGSQSVRLPKNYRLPGDRVRIHREGRRVILEPMDTGLERLVGALELFSDDVFSTGRQQPAMQVRAKI